MKNQLRLERHYWTGGRMAGCPFHRDVEILRPDGFGVRLIFWSDPREGVSVQCSRGITNRARRNFPTLKAALRYAVEVACSPADLWGYSRKAAPVEKALMARVAQDGL